MPDYVKTDYNVIWAQPDGPNSAMVALPCAVIDSIAKSYGAIENTYCMNSQTGQYEVVNRARGTPDNITFDLEELMGLSASEMEKAFRRDCPVPLYVGTYQCSPRMTFAGFDRMKIIQECMLETATENTLTARDTVSNSMETLSMSASDIQKAFELLAYRKTTTEDQILRDIAHCGDPACYGICGPEAAICHTMVAVADAGAGVSANVLVSTDGGDAWAATAADPFAVDVDIASVVCFALSPTTWRWVVAQGTTAAGAPGQVAYTDNSGASWTLVDLGAVNGNFVMHGSAMFALDQYHIWVVDDQGDIWFSDDGAASFTEQPATNAVALYGINFLDNDVGAAVGGSGAANVILTTIDGGANWAATTTIGGAAADVPYAVTVHDRNTYFVTFIDAGGAGELWYTYDAGATWTQRALPTPTGMTSVPALFDIERRDRYCMFIAGEAAVGGVSYGVIYRTVNGGTDWEFWLGAAQDATGAGFQAVSTCHYNQAFAVGDITTTSNIYEVSD